MLENIIIALENFCIHQIREEYKLTQTLFEEITINVYIDIETEDMKNYRVYLASDLKFMQRISYLFLEEELSNEQTLIDMALETANLIVGSAKVISEDENKNLFTIKTPHLINIDKFNLEYSEFSVIEVGDDKLLLSIKELS